MSGHILGTPNFVRGWLIIGEVNPASVVGQFAADGRGSILPDPSKHEKGMRFDWDIGNARFLRCLLIEIAQ